MNKHVRNRSVTWRGCEKLLSVSNNSMRPLVSMAKFSGWPDLLAVGKQPLLESLRTRLLNHVALRNLMHKTYLLRRCESGKIAANTPVSSVAGGHSLSTRRMV